MQISFSTYYFIFLLLLLILLLILLLLLRLLLRLLLLLLLVLLLLLLITTSIDNNSQLFHQNLLREFFFDVMISRGNDLEKKSASRNISWNTNYRQAAQISISTSQENEKKYFGLEFCKSCFIGNLCWTKSIIYINVYKCIYCFQDWPFCCQVYWTFF